MVNYIELNDFLKVKNLASTGGQAKVLIRSGKVLVNGIIEKRNRRKLVAADIVLVEEKEYKVTGEMCRKSKD